MKKILLIGIVLVAAALRLWQLGSYPALNADEAAIGYNVYSLLETGKDEHGNSWPIHFQSFNDFKPSLYFYIVLPIVKTFGLNEWSVRIPGAIMGVLTTILIYLLAKELFRNEKLSLIAAAMLAISPWHIHFSRGGWEVNCGTFLITLGVWLFLKYVNSSKLKYLLLSVLSFTFSLYAYHAARIISPLLAISLVIIYARSVFKKIKHLIIAGVILILLLVPLGIDFLGPAGVSRAAGVGLFADQGPLNRINEQRGEHADYTSPFAKLLHNKATNYGLAFLENWASHFHGEFLFLSGDDIQRNKVPETGQMYLADILFVLIGAVVLLRKSDKNTLVVFLWLIIAPIASALTFQSPHALRAHNMVIPLVLISATGLNEIILRLKDIKRFKNFGYIAIIALVLWGLGRYLHLYWVHMAKEYPYSSQYGVKELVTFLDGELEKNDKKAMVTDRYDQPYILFLFYTKYDPIRFQKEHSLTPRDQYGFSTVRSFGRYTFTAVTNWDETRENYRDSFVAGTETEIPPGTNVIKEIYGTNGFKYFKIVAN